jgi:hypothetical protein
MTQVRDRTINNEMTPAVPTLFIWSDEDQMIPQGADTVVTFNNVVIQTPHFSFKPGTGRVILESDSSGWFMVFFETSITTYDEPASDTLGGFRIFKNGVEIGEGMSYASTLYVPALQRGYVDYTGIKMPVYLEKGDYIDIRGRSLVGQMETIDHSTRLVINFIPMKGWDNSQAGRIEYKGGVDR